MDRFRCRECGEAMHVKFQRSHTVLCRVSEILAGVTVDELLGDLGIQARPAFGD